MRLTLASGFKRHKHIGGYFWNGMKADGTKFTGQHSNDTEQQKPTDRENLITFSRYFYILPNSKMFFIYFLFFCALFLSSSFSGNFSHHKIRTKRTICFDYLLDELNTNYVFQSNLSNDNHRLKRERRNDGYVAGHEGNTVCARCRGDHMG